MIHNHPSPFLLEQFVSGDIEDQLAVILAAHVESCEQCQKLIKKREQHMAGSLVEQQPPANVDFGDMAENIMSQKLPSTPPSQSKTENDISLFFKDQEFSLPTPLQPLKKLMLPWKRSFANISMAKIDLAGTGSMYFLHIPKGTTVPVHSHKGNEFIYVVAGSFEDDLNEYITGDFAHFSVHDTHTPTTQDPDGCLLLVSVEGPFHFKKGWAKLLNPFGRFLF